MRSWSLKLLSPEGLLTELKSLSSILKSKRKDKIPWSIQWTKRSKDSTNKRLCTKLSWFPKKKKRLQQETLWKKLPSRLRRSSCQRRPFLMTGRKHSSVCSKEIRLFRQSKNSLNKSKMISFRLNLKFQELEMKLRKSKKSLKIWPWSFKRWRVIKNS